MSQIEPPFYLLPYFPFFTFFLPFSSLLLSAVSPFLLPFFSFFAHSVFYFEILLDMGFCKTLCSSPGGVRDTASTAETFLCIFSFKIASSKERELTKNARLMTTPIAVGSLRGLITAL